MIELFQLLNTCTSGRAAAYMLLIAFGMYLATNTIVQIFDSITDIIKYIVNKNK